MVVGSGESYTVTKDIQVDGYIIPKVLFTQSNNQFRIYKFKILQSSICSFVSSKRIWLGKKIVKNQNWMVGILSEKQTTAEFFKNFYRNSDLNIATKDNLWYLKATFAPWNVTVLRGISHFSKIWKYKHGKIYSLCNTHLNGICREWFFLDSSISILFIVHPLNPMKNRSAYLLKHLKCKQSVSNSSSLATSSSIDLFCQS